MAGAVYNSVEEFLSAVEAAIPTVAEEYIAPYVEDVLSAHIESDIYGVYSPKPDGWVHGTYSRRHALTGGIQSVFKGNVLSTTSVAAPSPSVTGAATWGSAEGAFFDLLASGNMGLWRGGFARPAIPKAQAEIDGSMDVLDRLFEQGLNAILG